MKTTLGHTLILPAGATREPMTILLEGFDCFLTCLVVK